jgi:large subunit ribosomal protein L35
MPKTKTNSGAKKRFTLTATGKIKRKHAFKNHILTKKTKKAKRRLRHHAIIDPTNESNVKRLLGIGK